MPSQNQSGTTTVVPLSSITRNANTAHIPVNVTTLSSQSSHIPVNVSTISAQNQTNTINIVSSSTGNTATLVNVLRSVSSATSGGGTTTITTIPPIAKVLPQQQHITNEILHHHQQQSHHLQHNSPQLHTAGGTPIYIHARTPNPGAVSNTIQTSTIGTTSTTTGTIIPTNATTFIPASGTIPYASSTSSFAVVPTSNRSIGTIHGIIPTIGSNQLQTVPVRFNPLIVDHLPNSNVATVKAVGGNVINVIPSALQVSSNNNANTGTLQTSTQHVALPKIIATISSPRPSILRKRDNEGSPIKGRQAVTSGLVSLANAVTSNCGNTGQVIQFNELIDMRDQREASPTSRPGSTDGSTTVSATSSPGLDQQEQEEQDLAFNNRLKTEFKFKTVEELVPSQAQTQLPQLTAQALSQHQLQQQLSTINSSNGEITPRKKSRKQQLTNENTNSLNIQYTINNSNNNGTTIAGNASTSLNLSGGSVSIGQELNESNYLQNMHNNNNAKSKESLPTEITVKKPQTVSLLQVCFSIYTLRTILFILAF